LIIFIVAIVIIEINFKYIFCL